MEETTRREVLKKKKKQGHEKNCSKRKIKIGERGMSWDLDGWFGNGGEMAGGEVRREGGEEEVPYLVARSRAPLCLPRDLDLEDLSPNSLPEFVSCLPVSSEPADMPRVSGIFFFFLEFLNKKKSFSRILLSLYTYKL